MKIQTLSQSSAKQGLTVSTRLVLKWKVQEINTKASCVDYFKDFNYFITIVILTRERCITQFINAIVIYKMDIFFLNVGHQSIY
jgi:hypothetical protein